MMKWRHSSSPKTLYAHTEFLKIFIKKVKLLMGLLQTTGNTSKQIKRSIFYLLIYVKSCSLEGAFELEEQKNQQDSNQASTVVVKELLYRLFWCKNRE